MMNGMVGMQGMEMYDLTPLVSPVIDGIAKYLEIKERSETQRAEIRARSNNAISLLKNRRRAMVSYLNCRFGEREKLFNKYLHLVDRAIDSGNDVLMQSAFESILQVYNLPPTEGLDCIIAQCDSMNATFN